MTNINTTIIISSNPENLKAELENYKHSGTVEAEYGDICVEGSVITLAHHGIRSDNSPPCVYRNYDFGLEVIGLSHVDLDSLGGVLAVLGIKPDCDGFWEAAGLIDVCGAHKIDELGILEEDKLRLYSFWAWSKENRLFPPRDGSVMKINDWIEKGYEAIVKIVNNDEEMLEKGRQFRDKESELNKDSFVEAFEYVILRKHDEFVNHLYKDLDGKLYPIVISFNTKFNSVTISVSDSDVPVNCKEAVQALWGEKAGGHAGIAGSPRDRVMTMEDIYELVNYVEEDVYELVDYV